MRTKVRTAILAGAIVAIVLSVGSCRFLGFLNPAWALQGSWEITARPDGYDAFVYYVFRPGAEAYQIQDADGTVWQSGPILNLTDSSFDYQIEENTLFPEFVGAHNNVEYTLDRDDLTLVLYAGLDKSTQIGTLICVRE